MPFTLRAIDVGYGNIKYIAAADNGSVICRSFPSIAPLADHKDVSNAMGRRRRTVELEISGLTYEVGPDAHLAQGSFSSRNMDDGYCLTTEYLALIRGALHFMAVDEIDLLVVGLPVSTFASRRKELEGRLLGSHPVGPRKTVEVKMVRVLAQPQGALMTYLAESGNTNVAKNERNLIIDCGARTFDWLVAHGLQVQVKRSGALNRGMLDVVAAIADRIGRAESVNFSDLQSIDDALRKREPLKVFGRDYDISAFLPAARKVADEAVTGMRTRVQDGADLHNIILAGGGSFFFRPIIEAAFPKHRIHELADPAAANVRGFYIAGRQIAVAQGLVATENGRLLVGEA